MHAALRDNRHRMLSRVTRIASSSASAKSGVLVGVLVRCTVDGATGEGDGHGVGMPGRSWDANGLLAG